MQIKVLNQNQVTLKINPLKQGTNQEKVDLTEVDKMKYTIAIIIFILLCSCMSHRLKVGKGATKGYNETHWQTYFLGFVPMGNKLKEITQGKTDYNIYTRANFLDFFIFYATLGIITSRTITIYE